MNATGGALNPDKCYWYLIYYECRNGVWEYGHTENYSLTIPLPNNTRAKISQLHVTEAKKMLGVWSNPIGSDEKHLKEVVVGKIKQWASRIKNAHLLVHLVWKAYRYKLWPGVHYGIATLATPLSATTSLLHNLEFKILGSMGVNRNVKMEWRTLAREFGGISLYSLTIEQFISCLEVILQHYCTGSTLSLKMHASLEALQLEVGCCGNPLNKDYRKRGGLATECWVKAVWERVWSYNFAVHLDYTTLTAPQENDQDLVDMFIEQDQKDCRLQSLNRCRITHQLLHLSCILTADGRQIDPFYLSPPKTGMRTSSIQFAWEKPTTDDWITWERFRHSLCNPGLQLKLPLGQWIAPGHRIWLWLHDEEWDVAYHQSYTTICAYTLLVDNRTRSGNLSMFLGEVNVIPISVVPITIAHINHDVVALRNNGPCLPMLRHVHETSWQVLATGGGSWMWDYISNKNMEPLWIVNTLLNGTAFFSRDGSFHRNKAPQVSGAGPTNREDAAMILL